MLSARTGSEQFRFKFPLGHGSLLVMLDQSHTSLDCYKDNMEKENNASHFWVLIGGICWV